MHIFPVLLTMIVGFLLALTQIRQEAVFFSIIGATLFFGLAISLTSWPSKYQVFNDRIRIVLGYLWHFDVPFSNIENAPVATSKDLWGLNLNFINSYSSDDILQIIRKHGAKIHITPRDRDLFLEHLNKALTDWRLNNSR